MCLDGPKTELDKTIYCQPAVLVTSLAAIERLRHENPQVCQELSMMCLNAQYKLIYLVVGNRKLYIDSWFQCGRVRLTCFCWLVIFRRRFVAKTYPGIFLETLLQVVLEFAAVDLINVRARAMQNASNNVSSGMMTVFLRSSSKLGDALEAAKLYVPPALGFLFLLSTDSRKFKCM